MAKTSDEQLARVRAYKLKHKGDVLAQARRRHARLRSAIITALGEKCVQYGHGDIRVLQIDHVFNNGAEERRTIGKSNAMYRYILTHVDSGRYQLLCANCNFLKERVRRGLD